MSVLTTSRPRTESLVLLRQAIAVFSVLAVLVLSSALAARHIPLTNDDANYVGYFSNEAVFTARDIWHWVLEEPLWRLGSATLGALFGPFIAYRGVIFFSVLGFFIAGRRLGAPLLLLAFFFVVDQQLGPYLYFLAVRQGVATTVFLLLLASPVGLIGAAFVAALIHSTFLLLLPGAIIAHLIATRRFRWAGIAAGVLAALGAILMLRGYLNGPLLSLDLGRRGVLYSRTAHLNANFYLVAAVQYGLVLWLARDMKNRLFIATACVAAVGLVLMAYNGMFGRVALSLDALVSIYLCTQYRRRSAQIAMVFFTAALLIGQYSVAKNAMSTNASWGARWALILKGF